jgi:ATP-dependent DNA helicase RecQ
MHSLDHILQSVFGLQQFRPHQRDIVEDVLAGHDVVCVMPTGAGKSLCFQLPAVVSRGLTIIVSPLISLMADQVSHLRKLKIPAMLLNSSQSWDEQRKVLHQLEEGFSGLLYIAPERFSAGSFQRLLPRLRPKLFVVDEAHCVSFWGHDFRPEYMRLAEAREQLGSPVTVAVTATATPQVRDDIVKMLGLRGPHMHVTGFDRPNLTYACRKLERNGDKDSALLRFLRGRDGSGIVYCSTRKNVELIAALLEDEFPDRSVTAYHAGMPHVPSAPHRPWSRGQDLQDSPSQPREPHQSARVHLLTPRVLGGFLLSRLRRTLHPGRHNAFGGDRDARPCAVQTYQILLRSAAVWYRHGYR